MHSMNIETITPTLAAQYLTRNSMNRPVSAMVVKSLAGAIKRGEWKLNGESIKFSADGRLLDGQHRLNAIIHSGMAAQTAVVRGIDSDAFDTLDQGRKRTAGDVLAIAGEKNSRILAAILRNIMAIERNGDMGLQVTPAQVENALLLHPYARELASAYQSSKARTFATAVVPAVLTIASERGHPNEALFFMGNLASGANLDSRSPILLLRERLIESHTNRIRRLSVVVQCAYTIRAWNAYIDDRPLYRLNYRPGSDEFPAIR